jgi:hypothetical protein
MAKALEIVEKAKVRAGLTTPTTLGDRIVRIQKELRARLGEALCIGG